MKSINDKPNIIKRSTISIALSSLVILLLVYINIQTSILYENSHGKNRALFGLIELIHFGYKYWLLVPSLIAVILGIVDWRKGGGRKPMIVCAFGLFACGFVFAEIWRLWMTS